MQIFYAPDITGDKYTLDEKESKHSVRVLRMKKGAPVRLIDGKGNLYEGVITDPKPSGCSVPVREETVRRDDRTAMVLCTEDYWETGESHGHATGGDERS